MSISIIKLTLMPLSQAVSWYAIFYPSMQRASAFYTVVSQISTFYCIWAVWNRLTDSPKELGYISMGCLAVASYLQRRHLALAATTLVLANFLFPAYYVLLQWSPSKLAQVVKKSDSDLAIFWAYVFKVYFVSCILFWSVVWHKFWKLPSGGYEAA